MPAKAKSKSDIVLVALTQLQAKQMAAKLEKVYTIEASIGDDDAMLITHVLREKVVQASGKVPDA